jgi:hypothetical protein
LIRKDFIKSVKISQGGKVPIFFLNFHPTFNILPAKMVKTLETEIRRLQRELAGVKKDQALLRLQPCQGDSEIRKKEATLDELDRRAKILNETLSDLTIKRQLLISQCTRSPIYGTPNLQQNSGVESGDREPSQDRGTDEGGKGG